MNLCFFCVPLSFQWREKCVPSLILDGFFVVLSFDLCGVCFLPMLQVPLPPPHLCLTSFFTLVVSPKCTLVLDYQFIFKNKILKRTDCKTCGRGTGLDNLQSSQGVLSGKLPVSLDADILSLLQGVVKTLKVPELSGSSRTAEKESHEFYSSDVYFPRSPCFKQISLKPHLWFSESRYLFFNCTKKKLWSQAQGSRWKSWLSIHEGTWGEPKDSTCQYTQIFQLNPQFSVPLLTLTFKCCASWELNTQYHTSYEYCCTFTSTVTLTLLCQSLPVHPLYYFKKVSEFLSSVILSSHSFYFFHFGRDQG